MECHLALFVNRTLNMPSTLDNSIMVLKWYDEWSIVENEANLTSSKT